MVLSDPSALASAADSGVMAVTEDSKASVADASTTLQKSQSFWQLQTLGAWKQQIIHLPTAFIPDGGETSIEDDSQLADSSSSNEGAQRLKILSL